MATAISLHLPHATVLRVAMWIGLAAILVAVREVVVVVFVALILAAALDPAIGRLERFGMPRGTAMMLLLLVAGGFLYLVARLAVPVVVHEAEQFIGTLVEFYNRGIETMKASPNPQVRTTVNRLLENTPQGLAEASEAVFGGVLNLFGSAFGLVGVAVLTVYGAVHQRDVVRLLVALAPSPARPGAFRLIGRIKRRLGSWLRGQLILGAIIFVVTYIVLLALGVRFALVLALIAGVTEWIPVVGPLLGAIPALLVAVSQYPMLGVWVLLAYVAIQQLENYLIVPRVMAHATGLNPLIVIVAILVGAKLAGILGIFIAVPMAIIASTWLEDALEQRAQREAAAAADQVLVGDAEGALVSVAGAATALEAAEAVQRTSFFRPGSPRPRRRRRRRPDSDAGT